ncbi:MAG: FKBP-type peptidyl-prolyl cis-trans isomerase, partial [Gemmatimonadales bacterium]
GWLHDGTLFETNAVSEPFEFRLGSGDVLEGWDEGIVGMRRGGKRKLIIPHELAYGETGEGEIPPFTTLVYDIELIDFRR